MIVLFYSVSVIERRYRCLNTRGIRTPCVSQLLSKHQTQQFSKLGHLIKVRGFLTAGLAIRCIAFDGLRTQLVLYDIGCQVCCYGCTYMYMYCNRFNFGA